MDIYENSLSHYFHRKFVKATREGIKGLISRIIFNILPHCEPKTEQFHDFNEIATFLEIKVWVTKLLVYDLGQVIMKTCKDRKRL